MVAGFVPKFSRWLVGSCIVDLSEEKPSSTQLFLSIFLTIRPDVFKKLLNTSQNVRSLFNTTPHALQVVTKPSCILQVQERCVQILGFMFLELKYFDQTVFSRVQQFCTCLLPTNQGNQRKRSYWTLYNFLQTTGQCLRPGRSSRNDCSFCLCWRWHRYQSVYTLH